MIATSVVPSTRMRRGAFTNAALCCTRAASASSSTASLLLTVNEVLIAPPGRAAHVVEEPTLLPAG